MAQRRRGADRKPHPQLELNRATHDIQRPYSGGLPMSLSVAIQMDPIHHIDIAGDSTFALAWYKLARAAKWSVSSQAAELNLWQ